MTSLAPNPLRDGGALSFTLSKGGHVDARLYDVSGCALRVLADHRFFEAGTRELRVDRNAANPLDPGVYFYRVDTSEGKTEGRKIVLE